MADLAEGEVGRERYQWIQDNFAVANAIDGNADSAWGIFPEVGRPHRAAAGTQRFLAAEGIVCDKINKVLEGRPHIVDAIKNGGVQLVVNTTEGAQALADSRSLRRAALLHKVPYFTTLAGANAAALGIEALLGGQLEVRPLQSYFAAA